ncbi:hypothetical protein SAMN05443247_04750 [Bradyrhizobium erythrophlei]|nr:hypothetical protein SAMN05443247_04750 [Bradyrhizobium erythrophlei]
MSRAPTARIGCMREQKITLGEMRESGPTRLLVFCQDFRCAHSVAIDGDAWPDHVRISDLEPKFTCQACGHRGADVRPMFEPARMGTDA